ncbi:hypothetical protein MKY48_13685 [Paenibacillus sp. FSL W8-0187]|uniref:hypothetical protein n=1 Tax=Paenibacillus sp. FSL W8-0187 TaxID=2921710 RepID=UPI0030D9B558
MKHFIVVLLLVFITGCQWKTDPIKLKPITLSEAYPESILEVDRIELLDGSTGERKVIEDQQVIMQFLSEVKDIVLEPDENQEGRAGYVFGISLYKGKEVKLGFIPNQINKIYYKTNIEFVGHVKAFFEEHFEREF